MISKRDIPQNNFRCHSGGAEGADSYFEKIGQKYGVQTLAYSYKTAYHKSKNKVELSESEYQEGILHVSIANETLNKFKIKRYMKLLARCWFQVKNSEQIFAISTIITKNNSEFVKGGTGWTVQMALDNNKEVFLFDQKKDSWFYWDYQEYKFKILIELPRITVVNFAGIGARIINEKGINAIEDLFYKSFKK
ncbi:hypothetical protein [Flavobacterium sp. ZB4R12]|uniref:hypothetical protein n=1 Tax=Flavobacterium sp. ZB4R12 TaxID=3398732 RepID=UPI003AB0865E